MMRSKYYWLSLGIVVLDQLTKWLVLSHFDFQRKVELIPGFLRFLHVQNTGVAFGLLNDFDAAWKPYTLSALAVVAGLIILYYSARIPAERTMLHAALAVTLGGITGNLIDRLLRGFVVDFIEFHVQDRFYWPAFNVADSAISVGLALLLIDTFRHPASQASSPAA